MVQRRQPELQVALFSLVLLLAAATGVFSPVYAQSGNVIVGTWISETPMRPNGSVMRTYFIYKANGVYESKTITVNQAGSLQRIDGHYTVQPLGQGRYSLHVEQTSYAPKQICIQGASCNAFRPPLPRIDEQFTIDGGVLHFGSGMVMQKGTLPPALAANVPDTIMITRPTPSMGGMQGPSGAGGGRSSSTGSSNGYHADSCRNVVEQQRCISLGGNSYMYTDKNGCRVCQYVP